MASGVPERFPIVHDDYHAKYIGKTSDGRQFFQTTPFVAANNQSPGCEYLALFVFDADGNLIEYVIDDLGPRETVDEAAANELQAQRIRQLGEIEFTDIEVKPFEIEFNGQQFGLVPMQADEEDEDDWVELMPGHFMGFYPPWDGYYDT